MSIRIGIIGGSGLGDVLHAAMDPAGERVVEPATPFGPPAAPIVLGSVDGVEVALLKRHGHGHRFNPSQVPYRANIFALRSLGCTHVVASGACGSLREHIYPGDVVLCDQAIDRTVARTATFFDCAAVHVELADPCCPIMREWLILAAERRQAQRVHARGTYVCIEGPSFSTRAEAAMHRLMGADVVGMTAMPEARLAREAQMAYCLVALPTDEDCWRDRPARDERTLLEEIRANMHRAVDGCVALLREALRDVRALRERPSPAHTALAHAIWSDLDAVDREELERLGPLLGGGNREGGEGRREQGEDHTSR